MDLYTQQQALAKAQLAYEESNTYLIHLADTRMEAERRISGLRQQTQANGVQLVRDRQQVKLKANATSSVPQGMAADARQSCPQQHAV